MVCFLPTSGMFPAIIRYVSCLHPVCFLPSSGMFSSIIRYFSFHHPVCFLPSYGVFSSIIRYVFPSSGIFSSIIRCFPNLFKRRYFTIAMVKRVCSIHRKIRCLICCWYRKHLFDLLQILFGILKKSPILMKMFIR